jgi:hypothetical protein
LKIRRFEIDQFSSSDEIALAVGMVHTFVGMVHTFVGMVHTFVGMVHIFVGMVHTFVGMVLSSSPLLFKQIMDFV